MNLYLFLFPIIMGFFNINIETVVEDFHGLDNEKDELAFIEKYKGSEDPSVKAYVVIISMKQAKYSYNPYKQLKIFITNKKKLSNLIQKYNDNIHLRYVRLLAQENSPIFLNYKGFIKEDKGFIIDLLKIEDDTDYLDLYIKENTSL